MEGNDLTTGLHFPIFDIFHSILNPLSNQLKGERVAASQDSEERCVSACC